MKKLVYSALSLVAVAFLASSCQKKADDQPVEPDKGSPAMMTIRFDNPQTRATGTPTDESKFVNGTIMVFRSGTGILDGMQTFTTASSAVNVRITAGTRDVYVVANATGADFSTVQNVSDLYNRADKYDLSSISATGTSLPMSGIILNQNCTAATVASPTPVSVTLNYIHSKVTIAWDLTALNSNMTNFTVVGAYILNVPKKSDYFVTGTDNLTTHNASGFLYGRDDITGFSGAYLPVAPLANANAAALKLTSPATNNGTNFFYIHENAVSATPTIVVIEATVDHLGTLTNYYYPIVINGSQNTSSGDNSASIARGKHYTVTAKIKGFGGTDPYAPITAAAIDVTIVPATWTPIVINQTFN